MCWFYSFPWFIMINERTCLLYLKPKLSNVFEHDNHLFPYKDIYNTFYPCYLVLVRQLYIEMLWFNQNSRAGFHLTAVAPWLRLKYFLCFICLLTWYFQMRLPSGQQSIAISYKLLRTPQFKPPNPHFIAITINSAVM